MFLKLNHQKLEIYSASRDFVLESYKVTVFLPAEERFAMATQIRRAALSVHLNIAEGSSRKSEAERRRFFEIARGSVVEIDAALDIANDLGYLQNKNLLVLEQAMTNCFKMLTGLINAQLKNKV
jgi:four helix bundle protein